MNEKYGVVGSIPAYGEICLQNYSQLQIFLDLIRIQCVYRIVIAQKKSVNRLIR